jgi:hypothetical protein
MPWCKNANVVCAISLQQDKVILRRVDYSLMQELILWLILMEISPFQYQNPPVSLPNHELRTPLHTLTFWASALTFRQRRPALDICRLLVNDGAIDTLIDDIGVIARRNMPKALLQYLQQQMYPPNRESPINLRFELASHIRAGGWQNVPDMIRMALGSNCLNKEVVTHRDSRGRTLLHHIARRWAHGDLQPNSPGFTDDTDESNDAAAWNRPYGPDNHRHPWRVLLSDTIRAGSPLHATDSHGRTPLCTLIRNTMLSFSDQNIQRFRRLPHTLNVWLIELHASGVDLQQYGDREIALELRYRANRSPNKQVPRPFMREI